MSRNASKTRPFLTAEWRYLVMLNYVIDPALIAPLVPAGTELDVFGGTAFLSLVGFRFISTKIRGVAIPFHRHFDEVNLRFYVRRCANGEVRRGVVFIQEIVPRRAIAAIARWLYHENYRSLPMTHDILHTGARVRAEYTWRMSSQHYLLSAEANGNPMPLTTGSPQQFIADHYWGYSTQPGGSTLEYRVDHPSWRVWDASRAEFTGDAALLYGPAFSAVLSRPPDSAFLADGSPVTVYSGTPLPV